MYSRTNFHESCIYGNVFILFFISDRINLIDNIKLTFMPRVDHSSTIKNTCNFSFFLLFFSTFFRAHRKINSPGNNYYCKYYIPPGKHETVRKIPREDAGEHWPTQCVPGTGWTRMVFPHRLSRNHRSLPLYTCSIRRRHCCLWPAVD